MISSLTRKMTGGLCLFIVLIAGNVLMTISCTDETASHGEADQVPSLIRNFDPVIISGNELPLFIGRDINEIVAFRYINNWVQIPLQIDERTWVDFGTIYNTDPVGIGWVTYTDSNTYVGPDEDPLFDEDDELLFMAIDVGCKYSGSESLPPGVQSNLILEIAILDLLDAGKGYAYLF